MAKASDIYNAIVTNLQGMTVAAGYNATYNVETRDDNIAPRPTSDVGFPQVKVQYGAESTSQSGFVDAPRAGMALGMVPVEAWAFLKDPKSGDVITLRVGKAIDDVYRAIGDMRSSVADVVRSEVIAVRRFAGEGDWATPYATHVFIIRVWYEYEARTGGFVATPTTLSLPTGITRTLNGGIARFAWDAAVSPAVGWNFYKNGTKQNTSLIVVTHYQDAAWQKNVATTYQIGAEDVSANEVRSDPYRFPYYPLNEPGVEYHNSPFLAGPTLLAAATVGASSPGQVLELSMRAVIEQAMLDDGPLSEVAYTVAGALLSSFLATANMPLVNIVYDSAFREGVKMQMAERTATVRVDVYDDADRANTDPTLSRAAIGRTLYEIEKLASSNADGTGAQLWDSALTIDNTTVTSDELPTAAAQVGNHILFTGRLNLSVRFKWPWRD